MPASDVSADRYLAFTLAMCREAGEILCEIRREGKLRIGSKVGFELVTDADLAVDQHLQQRIIAAFPDHLILSEETPSDRESDTSPCWIIDPLDGTANFVHGHDHVAVSVALSVNGETILGIVHAPFQRQTFWAVRGQGAFRDGQRIEVSQLSDARRALIATGFPHQRDEVDVMVDRLKPLLREFGDIRRLAAPALDICWVADGRLTGFVDRIHKWDVAAAGLIATEAGARLTTLQRRSKHTIDDGIDYLIAAPGIFDHLCAVLSQE